MSLPTVTDGFYLGYDFDQDGTQSSVVTFACVASSMDAEEVGGAALDAWAANIKSLQHNGLTLVQVRSQPLDGVSAATIVPAAVPATGSGDPGPMQAAMIITERTGLAGRSHRGRMFWPALRQTDVKTANPSVWADAVVANWQSAMDGWLSDLATAGPVVGVLSRALGTISSVTALVARPYIGTQRRRVTGGTLF